MPLKNNSESFNYKISKFFLGNNRLTVMALFLLLFLGMFSVLGLKTTGFPNPEIKFLQIVAIYPGAASATVVKDVTQPVENAIKGIDGISTFQSNSSNSVSAVSVTINDNASTDTIRTKVDAAIRGIKFPVGVDTPSVVTPSISGPDIIYSVVGSDSEKIYNAYSKVRQAILKLPETSSVEALWDLRPEVVVSFDPVKAQMMGVSVDQLKVQIRSLGENIPVVSGVTLNDKSNSIVTKLNGESLEDIKNLDVKTGSGLVKLSDFANVQLKYNFENQSLYAYNSDNKALVRSALTFSVKAIKSTDLGKYSAKINDALKDIDISDFISVKANDLNTNTTKTALIETYSQNDSNQEQVSEVVGGLVGAPLKGVNGAIQNLGWILGAIQLIFLVMLAFVSWRAAIVAALSIPLSILFAVIFLYFTGHDLNTLTLFSLVLVLGLVVDPTLVVLEAIQRKIDLGLKGKQAALAAIKDVGNGLFLATATNIIVFIPFAVISGILGQIFSYIPLTVIPALIGSYIIPLVFLAWIGSLILKKNKKKTDNEEKNFWPLAQWLIRTNTAILNGKWFYRLIIIIVAIAVPFTIAGYYFSTGKIKSVQFASSDDANFIILDGTFLPSISKENREKATTEVLFLVASTNGVKNIFPETSGFTYFINLTDKTERKNLKAVQISDEINTKLEKYSTTFFDIKSEVAQNGPPSSSYQVAIGVKSDNLKTLEVASKDVNNTLQKICLTNQVVTVDEKCDGGKKIVTKVDDGFTGKENKVIEILLDENKLNSLQLTIPGAPISALVATQIKQLYSVDPNNFSSDKSISKILVNGEEVNIVLDKSTPDPKNVDEIKNTLIFSPYTSQPFKLGDVAIIQEVSPKSSITRVKGETISDVQARLAKNNDDQGTAALVTKAITDYYSNNNWQAAKVLGLQRNSIDQYSEGDSAGFIKSFGELGFALLLSIILVYILLALFFRSFGQPLVILFTIPLTFIGVFPALSAITGGQFGFLEIIGIIILIGLVVNVAIFLIDAAKQKIEHDGWDDKKAIAYASGLRLRPVLLTKFTAIASLLPLALFSEFYRSIAVVIMFGLLTSGFTSLFTTPILFIFFRSLSRKSRRVVRKIFRLD